MKIGVCVGPDRLPAAHEAGFAFAEVAVVEALRPRESDAEWRPLARKLEASPLPIEATNVFFPGDLHLVGPEVDPAAVRAYVDTAVRRAADLGVQVMVFGSGRARTVPEGYPHAQAMQDLHRALQVLGEAGARYGVTIALEPLRQAETNLLHTVREATEVAREVALPRVRVLADSYHMAVEAEPFGDVYEARDLLAHVHVSDADRGAPSPGGFDYAGFFGELKRAGYDERISVECRWEDWPRESAEALALLRPLAE